MGGAVAVLDIGKTNAKLALFTGGAPVSTASCPNRVRPGPPFPHYDVEALWDFALDALGEANRRAAVGTVVVTAHGAAVALATETGLALPIMDYEWPGPDAVEPAYAALRPPFAETGTLPMAGGLNWGKQVFLASRAHPDEFARTRFILPYPQYWSWRLTGVARSEVTSLGCHSDMWSLGANAPSSLVARCGWTPLLAPLAPAWESLGGPTPEVRARTGLGAGTRVLVGLHDSNASLLPFLLTRAPPFTVVSTGTWVIVLAVGASLDALDPATDIMASIDVTGRPSPVARFMGGREWDLLAAGAPPASPDDLDAVLASGGMALPAFAPHAGPFKGRAGRIEGEVPARPGGRAALASLYLALVTEAQLDALGARRGPVIVDGHFAENAAFCAILAALLPDRPILAADAQGSAFGAALLATWPAAPERVPVARTRPFAGRDALMAYRARWRAGAGLCAS